MFNANDVASVIVARRGTWTDSMTLQKLIYYVQAWHLAITDRPLFHEAVKAWEAGPVVLQATRRSRNQDLDGIELDDQGSILVDLVLDQYGSLSAEELSKLTHSEEPWLDARRDVPEGESSNSPISHESMARYYRKHSTLNGQRAADIAAGGANPVRQPSEFVDVDAILASFGDFTDDVGEDPWGGGNLMDSSRFRLQGRRDV